MEPPEQVAFAFLLEVYEKIKHGDRGHQIWLQDALIAFAPRLAEIIKSAREGGVSGR